MLHTLCSHSPQKEVFPTTSGSRALPSLLTYIALPEPVFMCSFLLDSRQWFQELQSLLCLPRLGRRRPGHPPGLLWASRPAPSQPPASGGGDSWDGAGRRPRSRPESGVTSPSEGPLVLRALTPASRALSPPEASPLLRTDSQEHNLRAGTHGRSAMPCVPLGGREAVVHHGPVHWGLPRAAQEEGPQRVPGAFAGPGLIGESGAGSLSAPYVEGTVHMQTRAAGSLHCQMRIGRVSMWPVRRVCGPIRVASVQG